MKDRVSFIRFSGFSISGTLPDHFTICCFRNALLEHNLFERLFEVMAEDRQEVTHKPPSPVISYSDDPDATWVKKGKKPYYGYKAHIAVDTNNGFILGGHVTVKGQVNSPLPGPG